MITKASPAASRSAARQLPGRRASPPLSSRLFSRLKQVFDGREPGILSAAALVWLAGPCMWVFGQVIYALLTKAAS